VSAWELAAALVPTAIFLIAGIALIEHLRVKGEGRRYEHKEFRVDEQPRRGNGKSANGHSGNGRRRS